MYNVLYVDPPWSYRNKRTGGSMTSGSAAQYPTMTLDELVALPIKNLIAKDCVLFLWVTVPMLPDGLALMQAWGFKYKTMLTWRKIMSLGMGYWFRGQTEHLLLGVRGRVKAFRMQIPNFHQCKALKHSHKPGYFRELIEQATAAMPDVRRLELFATESVQGWDTVGLEIDGVDIRKWLGEIIEG